jgi:hypothetical protein
VSGLSDLWAIGKQVRKGPYEPNPNNDLAAYLRHHDALPAQPGEQVTPYTGNYIANGLGGRHRGNMVGLRLSDNTLYVDPVTVEPVGPIAKLAQLLQDDSGRQPQAIPLAQLIQSGTPESGLRFQLPESVGGGAVQTVPGADMRRPNEMSGTDQLKQTWRLLRGK